MMPLGTDARVIAGYAAFNLVPGGWIGVIVGDRYCEEHRETSGEALADAKELFERVG